jgi:hypothetical protein
MALGSTQLLTEMSTMNFPGRKGRPARKADLTAVSQLSTRGGSLDVSQPYGPPWSLTGLHVKRHDVIPEGGHSE